MTEIPDKESAPAPLVVPPHLVPYNSPIGIHRRGIKTLVFGPTDGGKSFFLAHMPSPKVVIDANEEGGIQTYLRPNDVYFNMSHPEAINSALGFVLENEAKLKSVCIDGMTGFWDEFMGFWAKKLNVDELKASDWRKVKGPWKLMLKKLMRSKLNVGFSAWLKDVLYDNQDGKALQIRQVDIAQVEKTLPYTVDFILKCDVQLDRKMVPTQYRTITVYKARRPRSISPEDLFSGKQWKFDQKNPVDPWQIVIEPYLQRWQEGAVDYLGVDPQEEIFELKGLEEVSQDGDLARVLRLIQSATDMRNYEITWGKEIDPLLRGMSADRLALITEAHARKRAQLGSPK